MSPVPANPKNRQPSKLQKFGPPLALTPSSAPVKKQFTNDVCSADASTGGSPPPFIRSCTHGAAVAVLLK